MRKLSRLKGVTLLSNKEQKSINGGGASGCQTCSSSSRFCRYRNKNGTVDKGLCVSGCCIPL